MKGFDQAVSQLQPTIAAEISWLTPDGERRFDPVSVVLTLGGVLLTGFLAGFTEEAKKVGKKAGKAAFHWLEGIVKDVFDGKKNPEKEKLEELASEAPALAASAKPQEILLYAAQSEEGLRIWLQASMPPDRATALASKIREVALQSVLN